MTHLAHCSDAFSILQNLQLPFHQYWSIFGQVQIADLGKVVLFKPVPFFSSPSSVQKHSFHGKELKACLKYFYLR